MGTGASVPSLPVSSAIALALVCSLAFLVKMVSSSTMQANETTVLSQPVLAVLGATVGALVLIMAGFNRVHLAALWLCKTSGDAEDDDVVIPTGKGLQLQQWFCHGNENRFHRLSVTSQCPPTVERRRSSGSGSSSDEFQMSKRASPVRQRLLLRRR